MEITINGMIGDFTFEEDSNNALNSSELSALLENINSTEELVVKINSIGGSVFEGFSMYNQLKSLPNAVKTEINGMAASIASLIALAGDSVDMSEVSMLMIHRASTMAMGNQEELEKQQEILKSIDDTLVNVYVAKTGLPQKEVEDMLADETWLTSSEALDKGFVDTIINKVDPAMAAIYLHKTNPHIMKLKSLFASFKNELESEVETTETEVVETPDVVDTPEEPAAEEPAEAEAKYVTMEQFQKLLDRIEQMAQSLDDSVEEQATAAVEKLKTGLKKTDGAPTPSNNSVANDPTKGWVDQHAGFRAQMKEIEDKTRLS